MHGCGRERGYLQHRKLGMLLVTLQYLPWLDMNWGLPEPFSTPEFYQQSVKHTVPYERSTTAPAVAQLNVLTYRGLGRHLRMRFKTKSSLTCIVPGLAKVAASHLSVCTRGWGLCGTCVCTPTNATACPQLLNF